MFHQIVIHEPEPGCFFGQLLRCDRDGDRTLHETGWCDSLEEAEAECRDVLAAMYGPVNRVAA